VTREGGPRHGASTVAVRRQPGQGVAVATSQLGIGLDSSDLHASWHPHERKRSAGNARQRRDKAQLRGANDRTSSQCDSQKVLLCSREARQAAELPRSRVPGRGTISLRPRFVWGAAPLCPRKRGGGLDHPSAEREPLPRHLAAISRPPTYAGQRRPASFARDPAGDPVCDP
jgi:hypothetical protein